MLRNFVDGACFDVTIIILQTLLSLSNLLKHAFATAIARLFLKMQILEPLKFSYSYV